MTVCVGYADLLARSIDRWLEGLDSLLVITDRSDEDTLRLAAERGATVFRTDVFYANGADFNKGAALEAGRRFRWSDWMLLFDADITPPQGWRDQLGDIEPGYLYGAVREDIHTGKPASATDVPGVGYFQLMHTEDPALMHDGELIETHWRHAGNYDNALLHRWPRKRVRVVPFHVKHNGQTWQNWCGIGNADKLDGMLAERKRTGRRDHECVRHS